MLTLLRGITVNLAVLVKMVNLTNWIFEQFPLYFRQEDTYKDETGAGLLERYLRVFGSYLQEEIKEPAEQFNLNLNPLTAHEDYINHLAYTMGQPPDFFQTPEEYRKFLSIIVSIYKIKGTLQSYQILFGYLGFGVQIVYTQQLGVRYDGEHSYDEFGVNYDSLCPPCIGYYLGLTQENSLCLPLADGAVFSWDLNNFETTNPNWEKILCFIEPINVKAEGIIPLINVCELFQVSFLSSVLIEYVDYTKYDTTDTPYDASIEYDTEILTTAYSVNTPIIDNNAYYLMTGAIGSATTPIDFIGAFNNGIIIGAYEAESNTPTGNSVEYIFEIPFDPDYPTIDELVLTSSLAGEFTRISGLTIINQNQLLRITWVLSINDCEE